MNITRFSIKRPIGICMIYILVCVLGLISFFRIGVELPVSYTHLTLPTICSV